MRGFFYIVNTTNEHYYKNKKASRNL
jgi:hypothetical protein